MWVVRNIFNFMCCASALSETTSSVTVQTLFNHPKVTATRQQRPLLAAKSESDGGRYFRNSTVPWFRFYTASAFPDEALRHSIENFYSV